MKEGKIIKNSHQKIYSRAILPCKNDDIIIETGTLCSNFQETFEYKTLKNKTIRTIMLDLSSNIFKTRPVFKIWFLAELSVFIFLRFNIFCSVLIVQGYYV